MIRAIGFLMVLVVFLSSGCASDDEYESELDYLWRQGYGFNNPNVRRIKSGEPPLNMDGTVHDGY